MGGDTGSAAHRRSPPDHQRVAGGAGRRVDEAAISADPCRHGPRHWRASRMTLAQALAAYRRALKSRTAATQRTYGIGLQRFATFLNDPAGYGMRSEERRVGK